MMISTKGRYALRIMIDLAQHRDDGPIPLKEISARQNTSLKYLEAIAGKLNKGGLIEAKHGKNGGYQLTRSPADISAGEILRAAEGDLQPVACQGTVANCAQSSDCLTLPLWQKLDDRIYSFLDSVSLDDVMTGNI
ncbi:MAG: Rrf2 family transcriptional regulator [Clostridia bacterium]|nr:Rrf2 family transcriptional regulator [Clostridia bacterium]